MRPGFIVPLVILLIVVGSAVWLYTPDLSAAVLRARYGGEFVEAAGLRLRVKDTGPRDAPAVILLHGFGASLDTWDAWATPLSRNHRVIRFDLPGFGLTGPDPSGDYTDQRSLKVLAALMDRLGVARASLIGNSLGGKIAWNFAVADPGRVQKLILISPDGFASPGFEYGKKPDLPFILRLLPYVMPRPLLRMNLAVAYADKSRLTGATLTRYDDMMRAPGDRAAMLARLRQVMLEDPAPLLRRIQAPTLILWGEQDRMIPFANAADYLRAIPNAQLVALPGLGHVPFEEDPAQSLPPVEAFLAAR